MTDKIIELTGRGRFLGETRTSILPTLCRSYAFMCRPPMARECTELFPRLYEPAPAAALAELRGRIGESGRKALGSGGFAGLAADVADIEMSLGIRELSEYTPG